MTFDLFRVFKVVDFIRSFTETSIESRLKVFFFIFFYFFFYFKIRKVRPFHSRTKSWREKYFDTEISRGKKMNKTCTSDLSKLFSNFSALLCGSNVSFLSLRVIVTFTKKKKEKKKKKKERKEKRKKEKKKREKEKLGCNKFVGIWSRNTREDKKRRFFTRTVIDKVRHQRQFV